MFLNSIEIVQLLQPTINNIRFIYANKDLELTFKSYLFVNLKCFAISHAWDQFNLCSYSPQNRTYLELCKLKIKNKQMELIKKMLRYILFYLIETKCPCLPGPRRPVFWADRTRGQSCSSPLYTHVNQRLSQSLLKGLFQEIKLLLGVKTRAWQPF